MLIKLLKPFIQRFPRLAMTYRRMRDSWRSFDQPRQTPMGFLFSGNAEMQAGRFEPEETRLVIFLLKKSEVLVNVGANVGYYACLALSRGVRVLAFEPEMQNAQYLLRNIHINGWGEQVEVYPLALSNNVGVIQIYGGGTGASIVEGYSGTARSFSNLVPCTTLEHLLGQRLAGKKVLAIIDVEGAERLMLEGARNLVRGTPPPIWMVEIAITENQPAGVKINPNLVATFALFWDAGYEAWAVEGDCRRIQRSEIEAIAAGGTIQFKTRNFIFMQADLGEIVMDEFRGQVAARRGASG